MDFHSLPDGRLDSRVDPGVRGGCVLAGEEYPTLPLLEDVLVLKLQQSLLSLTIQVFTSPSSAPADLSTAPTFSTTIE